MKRNSYRLVLDTDNKVLLIACHDPRHNNMAKKYKWNFNWVSTLENVFLLTHKNRIGEQKSNK